MRPEMEPSAFFFQFERTGIESTTAFFTGATFFTGAFFTGAFLTGETLAGAFVAAGLGAALGAFPNKENVEPPDFGGDFFSGAAVGADLATGAGFGLLPIPKKETVLLVDLAAGAFFTGSSFTGATLSTFFGAPNKEKVLDFFTGSFFATGAGAGAGDGLLAGLLEPPKNEKV